MMTKAEIRDITTRQTLDYIWEKPCFDSLSLVDVRELVLLFYQTALHYRSIGYDEAKAEALASSSDKENGATK